MQTEQLEIEAEIDTRHAREAAREKAIATDRLTWTEFRARLMEAAARIDREPDSGGNYERDVGRAMSLARLQHSLDVEGRMELGAAADALAADDTDDRLAQEVEALTGTG
ncbi:MAG: hypothetical protein ACRDMH_03720 [Solirubrobacterales bacterium]